MNKWGKTAVKCGVVVVVGLPVAFLADKIVGDNCSVWKATAIGTLGYVLAMWFRKW